MEEKTKERMLQQLDIMLDENRPYHERLEAYEYLQEDCDEIVDVMLEKLYAAEGEAGKMLIEVLAGYPGNKAIFMGLVSYLYKGEDVALFAHLIGSYGDEQGVEVLKTFCEEYEPNYNEYMEIRNAVEELGGDFDLKEDFSDDPLYRYLKGLDEEDDSRRSPFEGMWKDDQEDEQEDDCDCCHDDHDDCDDDCDCCHEDHDDCDDDCCDGSHEHCDCCHDHLD